MSRETINWEVTDTAEEWHYYQAAQAEKIQKIINPETATTTLGDIALRFIIGGSMTGAVLPTTEAYVMESMVATTQVGDRLKSPK